jgi:hypothetical protein
MSGRFLNVDLELTSRAKLDAIVHELGENVFVMYSGLPPGKRAGHFVVMELEELSRFRNPDKFINGLCALLEKLKPSSRRLLKGARKVFDVGYELLPEEKRIEYALAPETLRRVAALGASIAVTCYRGDED